MEAIAKQRSDAQTVRPPGLEPARGRDHGPLIRACDAVLSGLGLLLSAPLMGLIALAIWLESGRPVFFVQERLGYRRESFRVVKFRTMVAEAEENGPQWAEEEDDRVTWVGRLLRRSRLDELPQLVNILRGDMTFVGPRPIREHFVPMLESMDPEYARRFEVKPGLTGWAQLYAPYGSTLEEQLEKLPYDLRYLDGLRFRTYARLIGLTALSVFRSRGR